MAIRGRNIRPDEKRLERRLALPRRYRFEIGPICWRKGRLGAAPRLTEHGSASACWMKTILGWMAMLDQLRAFAPHIPRRLSNRPALHALKRNPAALTGVAAGGRLRSTES